ncbi:MAG: 4Fe-4S binding protein [Candidatus Bathyarchaeia archaeon]
MPRSLRLIVTIDEEVCIGCGRCVKACLTGALQLVNGKSRLVDERRCDGFGSCIAACPNNAIRLELREAEEFDWSVINKITFENLMKKLEMTSSPLT